MLVASLAKERIFVARQILRKYTIDFSDAYVGTCTPSILWNIFHTFRVLAKAIKNPVPINYLEQRLFHAGANTLSFGAKTLSFGAKTL